MASNFEIDHKKLNEGINKKDAFENYKIADYTFLDELEGRSPCPECCKSRKFFCYTCYVPMPPLEGRLPKVKVSKKHNDGKISGSFSILLVTFFPSSQLRSMSSNIPKKLMGKVLPFTDVFWLQRM